MILILKINKPFKTQLGDLEITLSQSSKPGGYLWSGKDDIFEMSSFHWTAAKSKIGICRFN